MSAWKSPLLYLGILIIAVAAAALAAPLFIDWDGYRERFEAYGRELTGREVRIAGPIDARLFPWPVLRLNDVKVANPEGAKTADLFTAGEIELRMQLAPLLSGHVVVEAIDVDRPVFGFERLASDEWSWRIVPERPTGPLLDPERVSVSAITLTNGAIVLADGRRGGSARLDGVEATLSAPSLSGPWRMRGAASYRGGALDLALSTGKVRPAEATSVSVTIDPRAGGGFSYKFDGEVGGTAEEPVRGRLKIAPKNPPEDAEQEPAVASAIPDFSLRADVAADFDTITLTEIEIAPVKSAEPGKFITGTASIGLGSDIEVNARLEAARLDLDSLLKDQPDVLRSAEGLDLIASVLGHLPDRLTVNLGLDVATLSVAGEVLDASRLKVEANSGRMRVEKLSVALPGQSRIGFSGLFLGQENGPQLTGELSVDSVSLRDLAIWALPSQRRNISEVWSGARGRLKLASKVDAGASGLRLTEIAATLDDSEISGGFNYRSGSDSELAIRFVADTLNLDRYAPEGLLSRSGREKRLDIGIDLVAASMGFANFQLIVQADRVALHGVEAQDIAVDIGANEEGVELRTVEIGNVSGARMDVAGLVRFPGEGIAGSVNALVDAQDARGLLRLFGILQGDPEAEPAWARALGALDLKLVAEATTLNHYTQASSSLTGTAGDTQITLDGRFDGELATWQDAHVKLDGEATSKASRLLAALTGLDTGAAGERPSSLKLAASGSFSRGISTTVESEILGAKLQFAGMVSKGGQLATVEGRGAVLAERAGDFLNALDLPTGELSPLAGVLSAESEIAFDGQTVSLAGLSGTAGGSSYSGDLKLTLGQGRSLTGKLNAGRVSLPWLLRAALMPPEETVGMEGRFKPRLPDFAAIDLSVATKQLETIGPLAIEDAEMALKLDAKGLAIDAKGKGPVDIPSSLVLTAQIDDRGASVSGSVEGGISLQDVFRAEDGAPVIDGKGSFKLSLAGVGRTPAGLIASSQASGDYDLAAGTLKRVDPKAFGRDLAFVRKPAEIDGLISGSLRSGDVAFTGGKGKLSLAGGVLSASPLVIAGEGMTGEIRMVFEPASASADIAFTLSLLDPPGLPSFELAYAGPPAAMQPSSNTQELKSRLAVKVLQEGIDQLEEIQRQERELMKEEEAFRREQEQRRELDLENQRRLRELEARRKIEAEPKPPETPALPAPAAPTINRGASQQTDPAPAPAVAQETRAEVPRPRRKPAQARVELDTAGPTVLPQSLAPAPPPPTPWPALLFPNEPPAPLSDFPSRATGRDR